MRLRGLHLGGEEDENAAAALVDAVGSVVELALHLPVAAAELEETTLDEVLT